MPSVGLKMIASKTVVWAGLDDEAILLNIETGTYFGLNPVAAKIWEYLTRGAAEEEIVSDLVKEFDADPAQVRADLAEFLAAMLAKGLVRSGDL